jgi:hypothetical protein
MAARAESSVPDQIAAEGMCIEAATFIAIWAVRADSCVVAAVANLVRAAA